jgi:rhomboid-like protein
MFYVSSWTLVTSSFSHADPGHALLNGLTFWFLAPVALRVLGNAQFLVLYLGSAFFSPTFS